MSAHAFIATPILPQQLPLGHERLGLNAVGASQFFSSLGWHGSLTIAINCVLRVGTPSHVSALQCCAAAAVSPTCMLQCIQTI
jgi:hypothetical protein